MPMKRRTLLLLNAAVAAHAVFAQSGDPDAVPEVRVSARADAAAPATVPATVIDRAALERRQAGDLADVFAGQPDISVGGGAPNARRLYLRGLDADNLNITIDGAHQGRSLHQHRGDLGGLDPMLLKEVAVQPGARADAGPGALGGTIRFQTVDAQDLLGAQRDIGATVRGAYASADGAVRGGASVYGLAMAHVGVLAYASAANRDDYRIGGGTTVPDSGGQDRDALLKVSVLDVGDQSLRLGASRHRDEGLAIFSRVGSDNGYPPAGAVPTRERGTRTTITLEHRYRPAATPLVDTALDLYLNRSGLDDLLQARGATTRERGASVRNTASFGLGALRGTLAAGADYVAEDGATVGLMGIAALGPGRKTTSARNLGLFARQQLAWRAVQVALGVRRDSYRSAYGPAALAGAATSPHAGAEVALGAGWSGYADYGEAVRASGAIPIGFLTSIDARANINDGRPLAPERALSRAAGIHWRGRGGARLNADPSLALGYFDTRIAHLIEWAGQGAAYPAYIRNMPDPLRTRGWEAKAAWSGGGVDATLGMVAATTTIGGRPFNPARRVGAAAGDRLVWDTRWQVTDAVSAGYTLNAARRLADVPAGAVPRAGYVLHDLQLQWRAPRHGLLLGVAIRNIGDRRYGSQTSLDGNTGGGAGDILPEPGRDVRLSASYAF